MNLNPAPFPKTPFKFLATPLLHNGKLGRMIRYKNLAYFWLTYLVMPRAELPRHTVIVLSVRLSVCYKHFSSLAEN